MCNFKDFLKKSLVEKNNLKMSCRVLGNWDVQLAAVPLNTVLYTSSCLQTHH